MNNFLVWGIAFGPRGQQLAPIWLDSLLTIGNWKHDIVILGDKGIEALTSPRLKAFNIVQDVKKRYSCLRRPWTRLTLNNLKSQIRWYVDLTAYNYIVYLDMDVLTNSDQLETLVRSKSEKGIVSVQRDCISLPLGRLKALSKLGLPNKNELALWAKRPICAGIMGFPINQIGLAVFEDYYNACKELGFQLSDQAKLAALLNRKYDGMWEFFGDTTFGRRLKPSYKEILIHFSAKQDALLIQYYLDNLKSKSKAGMINQSH